MDSLHSEWYCNKKKWNSKKNQVKQTNQHEIMKNQNEKKYEKRKCYKQIKKAFAKSTKKQKQIPINNHAKKNQQMKWNEIEEANME